MSQKDSWSTESGLLDDFDLTFEEVWFGTDPKYQEGKALLFCVRGPAEQEGEVVDEEHTVYYSCGDGWKAKGGGEAAVHSAGKTRFIDSSNMGKLIQAVAGIEEAVEVLRSRGESFEADSWRGLVLHMERKTYSYKDRKTGEERSYDVLLPVGFVGVEEGEEEEKPKPRSRAKAAAKKPAPRSRAKKAEVEEEAEEEAPKKAPARRTRKPKNDLRAAVVVFAAEFEEHADFVEAVFDSDEFDRADEISDDEELTAEILDEESALWEESR